MKENNQKRSFLNFEADAWFDRNKEAIINYNSEIDNVILLIKKYNLNPNSVLEIGSSSGYRLKAIKDLYKNCTVYGVEPSKKAIKYGISNNPSVNFIHGTADSLECVEDNSMDIVIVGFVFYVIDRNILLKVVSEIDRVLKNNGILVIIDFFSESSLKNAYEHIESFSAFSYKQDYYKIFTASKLYYLLNKSTYNHNTGNEDASEDYFNKFTLSLLKKDINSSYK